MPTIKQLVKKKIRKKKAKKTPKKILLKCPQRKGICWKLRIVSPKKPNSAQRKVANIHITVSEKGKKFEKMIKAQLIGEGPHNVQKYTTLLIRGARVRDLPGINYRIIRNKYDVNGVTDRVTSRSKYGTRR